MNLGSCSGKISPRLTAGSFAEEDVYLDRTLHHALTIGYLYLMDLFLSCSYHQNHQMLSKTNIKS